MQASVVGGDIELEEEHVPIQQTYESQLSVQENSKSGLSALREKETLAERTVDIEHGEKHIASQAIDAELQSIDPTPQSPDRRGSSILSILRVFSPRTDRHGIKHEPLSTTDLSASIVGWTSQLDPCMPYNFTTSQKLTWVLLLSLITFLTPFASSILSPAITSLDAEFGVHNQIVGSTTVSIYLLGYVVGPIFVAPLSEIYGRKQVLSVSNAWFCLWQIGCALAPNVETLVVARFTSGLGGVACLTLGGSIIGDLYRPDQRAFYIGMWNLGPLAGPTIGPILGGYLTEAPGWRYDFWIVFAAATPVTILLAFLTKETSHKVIIRRKTVRLQKELSRNDLRSCYDDESTENTDLTTMAKLLTGLKRPLKMLVLSPHVFFLSLYIAFVFGVVYLLYTTIPSVFESRYDLTAGQTGLVYLSLGLGNTLGWLVVTLYSDTLVVRLARANGGKFMPEMRLTISIYFGFFLPLTLFWYGWSAQLNANVWSTILSLVPYGFGIMGLFLGITTYLVDSYPHYAASAIAANVILRSIVGALLPLAGPPMYSRLGLGWGNSLLGFVCILMIPLPLIFYKFGGRLREAQKFRV